jgi:hypothetical protein
MQKLILRQRNGTAALVDADGTIVRWFVWSNGGRHLCEIVGEGDRQRRVEVMISPTATAGTMYSDDEAMETLRKALGLRKSQVVM